MWLNGKLSIELKKYVEFRLIGKMHPRLRLCISCQKVKYWYESFLVFFLDLDIRKILGIWWQFCFQLSKIYLTKKYISFQFHEKIDNLFRQIAGNIPNAEFSCSTTIKGGKKKTADTLEASFIFCCV